MKGIIFISAKFRVRPNTEKGAFKMHPNAMQNFASNFLQALKSKDRSVPTNFAYVFIIN